MNTKLGSKRLGKLASAFELIKKSFIPVVELSNT